MGGGDAGKSVAGRGTLVFPLSEQRAAPAHRATAVRPDETVHPGSLRLSVCTVAMTTKKKGDPSTQTPPPPTHPTPNNINSSHTQNITTLEIITHRECLFWHRIGAQMSSVIYSMGRIDFQQPCSRAELVVFTKCTAGKQSEN